MSTVVYILAFLMPLRYKAMRQVKSNIDWPPPAIHGHPWPPLASTGHSWNPIATNREIDEKGLYQATRGHTWLLLTTFFWLELVDRQSNMTASAVQGKICNKPDMISCYLETCTSIESCSTLKYKCTPYAGSPKPVCMITIFIETMLLDMTAQENHHAWSFSSGVMCTRLCWISCWWELVGQNSILVVALFWVP